MSSENNYSYGNMANWWSYLNDVASEHDEDLGDYPMAPGHTNWAPRRWGGGWGGNNWRGGWGGGLPGWNNWGGGWGGGLPGWNSWGGWGGGLPGWNNWGGWGGGWGGGLPGWNNWGSWGILPLSEPSPHNPQTPPSTTYYI